MTEIREKIRSIFRQVFGDPNFELRDELTAEDVDGWDSLAHINLIIAIEKGMGVKFATAEISRMKEAGQNVGGLVRLINSKVAKK